MRKSSAILILATLAGCSTSPTKVKPTPVLGQPFASYDCEQLEAERAKAAAELEDAKSTQYRRIDGEAAGLIVVGVTGLLLAKAAGPEDQSATIGSLRGNISAIDEEAKRKECTSPEFGRSEPERKKSSSS